MNPWLMPLFGWLAMSVVMLGVWLVQRRSGDAGIVDAAWTFGVGALGASFSLLSANGNWPRRLLLAALVSAWALRLGGYIVQRLVRLPEDGRYRQMKLEWGGNAQSRLFWFFQMQALAAVLFALPMLIAAQSTLPLNAWDYSGLAVWCVALLGETVADRQMAACRHDPAQRGQVCRRGLWRYSRHPNYFFEWLHWWSYFLLALSAPWGWTTIAAPLVMLYLFLFVTGIPPTEAQSLRSRGDAYREYQRTTSAFFPWPPRT